MTILPDACPVCEATDLDGFAVQSKEILVAHYEIQDNGDGTLSWGGGDNIIWETATTQEYFCTVRLAAMPEELQERIDAALHNKRHPELSETFPS